MGRAERPGHPAWRAPHLGQHVARIKCVGARRSILHANRKPAAARSLLARPAAIGRHAHLVRTHEPGLSRPAQARAADRSNRLRSIPLPTVRREWQGRAPRHPAGNRLALPGRTRESCAVWTGRTGRLGRRHRRRSHSAAYGQAGIRASMPMWSVDPTVQSELFNVNGIAHKVVFNGVFSYTNASRNVDQLVIYDPIDDNNIQALRRRLDFEDYGNVFPNPGLPAPPMYSRCPPNSTKGFMPSAAATWIGSPAPRKSPTI